ncbi:hypothetical protein [Rhizobium populisoli]|uniref:hypothetical protein n=1 Tax=Rhizobium populisoli TaxID=2859785 RepID=UPI001FEA0649|nr:hypothetical protein [Rhizobium populisoli]
MSPTALQPRIPSAHPDQDCPERLVKKRIVLHFPGFEPLDANLHHDRYARSAAQSGKTWGFAANVGPVQRAASTAYFDISCQHAGHLTESRVYCFDHASLVASLNGKPMRTRILAGYAAAFRVVVQGGLSGYFRHAWRFGLFFIFPFLMLMLIGLSGLVIAGLPFLLNIGVWNYAWSLPLAVAVHGFVYAPALRRLHTLHLLADWELAVAMARLDRPEVNQWIETCITDIRTVLEDDADEYVITSHSMGSTVAAHTIGRLLAENPDILQGKRVAFVTLGGAILQCSLLRSAATLREAIGRIARTPEIFWLEIQCLTDSISFYKSRVVALAGHPDAPQASLAFLRIKRMVSPERYKRIKLNFLRVHRQYVLGSDSRSNFDFTLMTAGPLPAADFANFKPENLAGTCSRVDG